MTQIDVPNTFQGWCSLISRVLAPAEELSPFKLGQIQKLIFDMFSPSLRPRRAYCYRVIGNLLGDTETQE